MYQLWALTHRCSSWACVLQAQGYVIIASRGFNQVFLIENKQMISLYIAGINRNLIHEFPNYTAPFWKSVGIQILAVTVYNFLLQDRSVRFKKMLNMLRWKLDFIYIFFPIYPQ